MRYLRQNTARTVTVGPFYDVTDAVTPETALTVTNTHITLIVDNEGTPTLAIDADATASGGDNDMVHVTNDDAGYYTLELTAANVNYVGGANLSLNDVANHTPVFQEFVILPTQVYDSLVVGTDLLQTDLTQIGGVAQSATDLKDFADAGYDPGTNKVQGVVLVDTSTTVTGGATEAKQDTAQSDLDTITGSDGVTLATAQALYAPNKVVPDAAGVAPTAVEIRTEMDSNSTELAAIKAKTDNIPASPATEAKQDTLITAVADVPTVAEFNARSLVAADYVITSDTLAGVTTVTNLTNAPTAGDLTATMKASVNTEVVDTLNVDTYDEPGDEELTVNTTLVDKIGYLYKFLRNKVETTATRVHVYNAAETNKDQSATISDDGTTFTRGEFGAGD